MHIFKRKGNCFRFYQRKDMEMEIGIFEYDNDEEEDKGEK